MKELIVFESLPNKITDASSIFKKIKRIKIDYGQENYFVFYLSTQNDLLGYDLLFKGTHDACILSPNVIFRKALLNNSSKIIVAHNHPSNNLEPSEEDRDIYKRLKELGREIECPVLDSIIFNKVEFYSMQRED